MKKLTNISFIGLEFDFGYNPNDEESNKHQGRIDAEVFVEIDNDGEKSQIQYKTQLQDVSFSDFLSEEEIATLTETENNFSSFIQTLRKLITLKIASEMNIEVADMNYVEVEPLRNRIESLEQSQQENAELKERIEVMQQALDELILGGM